MLYIGPQTYKQLKTLKNTTVSTTCKSGHEDSNLAPKYSNSNAYHKTTTNIINEWNTRATDDLHTMHFTLALFPGPHPASRYCTTSDGKLGEGLGKRLALHHPRHLSFCYKHLVQVRVADHTCINGLPLTDVTSCSRPSWITVACSICS